LRGLTTLSQPKCAGRGMANSTNACSRVRVRHTHLSSLYLCARCLWALAVHAHAAGALPGPPCATRLLWGQPVLSCHPNLWRAAQVSDHGRFRSTRGLVNRGTLLNGFFIVGVGWKSYRLHRLVCTAWHGQPPTPKHTEVCHKDGDPSNNRPDNIYWATSSESIQRSYVNNPNRKSNAAASSKPVRGRKKGTADEWRQFESCNAAARDLGPGFYPSGISAVATGKYTQTRGWTFEFTQQCEVIEGEQWRSVVLGGVESGAQVSDRGRFSSTRGVVHGGSLSLANGYCDVGVCGKNYKLHRLICTAWHGPPPTPEHTETNHKDGDASNNQPDNLRWTTRAENIQYSYANNPNRKSNAGALSNPVRGRKQGTADEWRQFESFAAAARELGPRFNPSGFRKVASGMYTHTRGWEFELTQQYEEIPGELWKDVVLPLSPL